MRNSDFLRRQAEACIALSRATIDLTIAGRLRVVAAELRARAEEEDDEQFPAPLGESSGSPKRNVRN